MAIRFLFAMFPEADQYFRVQYDEPDDEGENVGLTYKVPRALSDQFPAAYKT